MSQLKSSKLSNSFKFWVRVVNNVDNKNELRQIENQNGQFISKKINFKISAKQK